MFSCWGKLTPAIAGIRLSAIGRDEYWLQDWLTEDPSRLGIGKVVLKAKEVAPV